MKKLLVSPLFLGAIIAGLVVCLVALLMTQRTVEDSPKGFVLPAGDVAQGKQAFVDLGCVACHTVNGVQFDAAPTADSVIAIGGAQPRVVSYGMLTTGIIHPTMSEDVTGESVMPVFNQKMTVEQLIDLVAFLREHYEVEIPEYYAPPTGYPYMPGP